MRFLIYLAIAALVAAASGAIAALPFTIAEQNQGEVSFSGSANLKGSFELFEDGDLCLLADANSSKQIPNAKGRVRVCFANHEEALLALGLRSAAQTIDLEKVCGLVGKATVLVDELSSGEGPARRWYTAKLVRVANSTLPKKVTCHG